MNSPILKAGAWASFNGMERDDFHRVLGWHLQHGHVWSGSDCFIMGRPVPKGRLGEAGELIEWPQAECDVWFVWLASGNRPLQRFLEVAPFKLPYVAWHRKKNGMERFKVWSWDQYDRVTKRFTGDKKNGNNV